MDQATFSNLRKYFDMVDSIPIKAIVRPSRPTVTSRSFGRAVRSPKVSLYGAKAFSLVSKAIGTNGPRRPCWFHRWAS
jgi:hypothetical protein